MQSDTDELLSVNATVEPSVRVENQFLAVLSPVIKTLCSVHVYHTPKLSADSAG